MALGALQNEGDLLRFMERAVQRPGFLPSIQPAVSLIKKGVPADSDFPVAPKNGTLAVDDKEPAEPVLYCRIAGEWKKL